MSKASDMVHAGPNKALMTLRIIWGALIQGVVIFAVIALVVRRDKGIVAANAFDMSNVLVPFGLGLAALQLVLSFVVPPFIAKAALSKLGRDAKGAKAEPGWEEWPPRAPVFWPVFQTSFIIRAALLEGAGFFNLIAYLITGSAVSITASAVIIASLLALFPNEQSIRSWMEQANTDSDMN